jgi:hypothetical protein
MLLLRSFVHASARSHDRARASPAARRGALVAVVALLLGGACGGGGDDDDGGGGPVGTQPVTCPSANVPVCTSGTGATARDVVSDASGRSTPALENTAARTALTTNLGQLDAAIGGGNITDARAALTRAREAITTARGQLANFAGDAADLAAIELILDQIAPLIGVS